MELRSRNEKEITKNCEICLFKLSHSRTATAQVGRALLVLNPDIVELQNLVDKIQIQICALTEEHGVGSSG